jgi:hypothetical protein
MTVTIERQGHQVPAADRRRRQLHVMQAMLAGAAAIAMLAVFDAGRPITAQSVLASGSVRLADVAADLPAQPTAHLGPLCPQSPPNLVGGAGFAADDTDDQALQQMQQAEQQAETTGTSHPGSSTGRATGSTDRATSQPFKPLNRVGPANAWPAIDG